MLATSLWRDIHHGALKKFEHRLLNSLATHIAGDGGVVALACNLVDLIDKHNSALGCLHVIVSHLQKARQYALDVLAHIACLGEHRGIDNGERHIEKFGYGACE